MSRNKGLNRIKFVSNFLIILFRLLPLNMRVFSFRLVRNFPSKLGVYFRYIIFKSISKESGENIYISSNVYMFNIDKIILGSNVSIHEMCYLNGYGNIVISDNVSIAHNCSLVSFDHGYEDYSLPIKYNPSIKKNIIIKNDVWLGAAVRILGGVKIEERTIIGAGSVVTKNVLKNSLYAGVPAKKIKDI